MTVDVIPSLGWEILDKQQLRSKIVNPGGI